MHRLFYVLVIAAFTLSGLSCSPSMVAKRTTETSLPQNARIAVLPFDNFSGKERIGQKLTEYFQTLMVGEPKFQTIEQGAVNGSLRRHRIRSSGMITREQIDTLVQELQVQYILTGSVLEFRELENSFLGNIPQISFNARLIDCATHQPVWVAVSNKSGDKTELLFGIGAVRSPDELMRKMVQEAISKISGMVKE